MSIDTKIEGSPDSVRSAADWLRSTLGEKISQTADELHDARNLASADWQGDAGNAFVARMTSGAAKAEGLGVAVTSNAQVIDDFAAELQRAQSAMQSVRDNAAASGLTVNGFIIQDPSPATAETVSAYATAVTDAEAAREVAKLAAEKLKNAFADVSDKTLFVVGDMINGTAAGLFAEHSSRLLDKAKFLDERTAKFLDLARSAPPGTPAEVIYRDFDQARADSRAANEARKAADDAKARSRNLTFKVGGALAVGGIAYDITQGKDVDQAIVSGGVGFGASVLAGAAIGTVIPVPVVGTLIGAAGGAAVGVFTSGAIDSLYQNGIGSVGQAINDGAAAVRDTGKTVGGLVKNAWDAIF
ncbi:WXG100 family type VII secretion target [Mycolicibacterium thermoresistibile]